MVESSKLVKPWREAVKYAALQVTMFVKIEGPVCLDVAFTMARPKSAKKGAVPSTRPDLSKLVRATEDALTDVGAWEDDARVVRLIATKFYVGELGALHVPGAVINIRPLDRSAS
jgi:crossover junction endodeoxyribonuclease RusA